MLAKIFTAALVGIETEIVTVETDLSNGFPGFTIVGLPDVAVQEARERLRAAVRNSGLEFPSTRRITVNLAPAFLRKAGASYDLPIAVSILAAEYRWTTPERALFVGELGLDGAVKPVHGVLAVALAAQEKGFETIVVPADNAKEARLVPNLKIFGVAHLKDVVSLFKDGDEATATVTDNSDEIADDADGAADKTNDLSLIRGQQHAKRALEIAAAGGHNLLFYGPPGTGKTMLSQALPGILPPPTRQEALEITTIYSSCGQLRPDTPLITCRPMRSPHHSASAAAIIGGGTPIRPGEITLAHHGVLFLDELPEFSRQVLEGLREPLESGEITIARSRGAMRFPARFLFIASMNPCPCGFYGDPEESCTCPAAIVARYRKKISGPIFDRLDLFAHVAKIDSETMGDALTAQARPENSAAVRARVTLARERMISRSKKSNAQLSQKELETLVVLQDEALRLLKTASAKMKLSARAFFRCVKVARTIADLSGAEKIAPAHVAEALQFRVIP